MEEAQVVEPCPSEASSICAAASERADFGKKLKEKLFVLEKSSYQPEKLPLVSSSRPGLLDLKLSSMEEKSNSYNKLELHLFNPSNNNNNVGSSPPHESSNEATREKSRVFSCNFCKREFSTSQALGGHQNAHKQESALAKRRHGMDVSPFGHPPPPYNNPYYHYYSSFPQVPNLYGSSNTFSRSLGVRADSMIHKPSSYHPWSTSTGLAYRFGQHDLWSNSTKSSIDKLKLEAALMNNNNNNTNNNSDGLDYSSTMASSSKFEGSGDGVRDFFGVSWNNNNLNLAAKKEFIGSEENNLRARVVGLKDNNQPDDQSLLEIDLNLKL